MEFSVNILYTEAYDVLCCFKISKHIPNLYQCILNFISWYMGIVRPDPGQLGRGRCLMSLGPYPGRTSQFFALYQYYRPQARDNLDLSLRLPQSFTSLDHFNLYAADILYLTIGLKPIQYLSGRITSANGQYTQLPASSKVDPEPKSSHTNPRFHSPNPFYLELSKSYQIIPQPHPRSLLAHRPSCSS